MNNQPRIDHLAQTIERVLMRGLESGKVADAVKVAAPMRIELDALRKQRDWDTRATGWTYPQEPSWTN